LSTFSLIVIGFAFFWKKNIGAKAACKMLVKLTKGVNFINILSAHFSYKSELSSFSLITVLLCDFLAKGYWQKKIWCKMLAKLTEGKEM